MEKEGEGSRESEGRTEMNMKEGKQMKERE
jgi:hypothetical protein